MLVQAYPREIKYRGYVSLKEEQLLVMDKFAFRTDMFVTMPTGFGLLVYGLLLTVFNCLQGYTDLTVTSVVSPLTYLMVHCTVATYCNLWMLACI